MSYAEENDISKIIADIYADNEKFYLLIDKYQNQLFYYIIKYIQDEDAAKDIVQEAFIKMYINLKSYDTARPFIAWAYRITHNEMINFLRKNKPTKEFDEHSQFNEVFDNRPDLSEEIDRKLEAEQLRKLLDKMPIKYREVLVLNYLEGCDYQTISQVIGKPTSTVGTRIRRAKDQLKKLYIKEYGSEA